MMVTWTGVEAVEAGRNNRNCPCVLEAQAVEFAATLDVGYVGGVKENSKMFDLGTWNDGDINYPSL